jgi:predicted N-acyltransferase
MEIVSDVAPVVDDIYPLYLQVYTRSRFHFEKLTKEFLCELGRRIPDKVRFFLWRHQARIVAFTISMVEDDAVYVEYIGLDCRRLNLFALER